MNFMHISEKIIVTNGLGFIGSNFVNLLIKKNYNINSIEKLTYVNTIKYLELNRNVSIYKAYINNIKKLEIF